MKKLFILGNPRSGTSLLRLMLNCHNNIVAPPESGFLEWWYDKYGDWDRADTENPERISEYVNDLRTSKKIETWKLDYESLYQSIVALKPDCYEDLSAIVYCNWSDKSTDDIQWIADKNNYYIHHLSKISAIWPNAYYLVIIRDGRDVACSYLDLQSLKSSSKYKPYLPNDIESIAKEWRQNNIRIREFFMTSNISEHLTIRYEDLICQTEKQLRLVCQFLDVKFDENMLRYHLYNSEPKDTLDWKQKTLQEPDTNNVGKFRKQLDPSDIARFEHIAKDLLLMHNYL